MNVKAFPTLAVLGVWSGVCLERFSDIAEVMDHLYPGIMTMRQAMMQPQAAAIIAAQHPELSGLPDIAEVGWRDFVASPEVSALGPTLDVSGPAETR